jgi:hypothetical protein
MCVDRLAASGEGGEDTTQADCREQANYSRKRSSCSEQHTPVTTHARQEERHNLRSKLTLCSRTFKYSVRTAQKTQLFTDTNIN